MTLTSTRRRRRRTVCRSEFKFPIASGTSAIVAKPASVQFAITAWPSKRWIGSGILRPSSMCPTPHPFIMPFGVSLMRQVAGNCDKRMVGWVVGLTFAPPHMRTSVIFYFTCFNR